MIDPGLLPILYGSLSALGAGYLVLAMVSGRMTARHGSSHGHHGGSHAGQGSGHGHSHQGGSHSGHGSGHQSGHSAGNSSSSGHSTTQSDPSEVGRALVRHRVVEGVERSAHAHLPHLDSETLWLILVDNLSPSSLCLFFTFFGLTGFILTQTVPSFGYFSLAAAALGGFMGRGVVFRLIECFSSKSEVNSAVPIENAVGQAATVCLPISGDKTGEIYCELGSRRINAPARSLSGEGQFERGARVLVVDIRDGIFYVSAWLTLD